MDILDSACVMLQLTAPKFIIGFGHAAGFGLLPCKSAGWVPRGKYHIFTPVDSICVAQKPPCPLLNGWPNELALVAA